MAWGEGHGGDDLRVTGIVDIGKPGILRKFADMGECGTSGKGPLGVFWPGNGIFH